MSQLLPFAILAGGFLQAQGITQEAESRASALRFNATVADQDAAITEKKRTLERGQEEKRLKTFVSTQGALFAKAGVTLSGSPIQVIEESSAAGELDIIIGDINASIEKSRLTSEADIKRAEAKSRVATGRSRAGLTLLGAGIKAAGSLDLFAGGQGKEGVASGD